MASLNKVFLIGNLTKDPEIRYTPSGKAVGDLRMAINRRFKTADGQERDETCFVAIVVWGRQAETCGEYLRKGSPIMVEGRLQYEEWEKDGKKNNRLRVVAERVQFMGGAKSGDVKDSHGSEGSKRGGDAGVPEEVPNEGGPVDEDNLPF